MCNDTPKLKTAFLSFEDFFKYRNVWMAFAILWVMLFHFPIPLPAVFSPIKDFGYGGVDIFLFASGIGCFFSLRADADIKRFLCRRARKILPMQIIFLFFYVVFTWLTGSIRVVEIIGNVFGAGLFGNLDNQFNWYIGAMWACYLIAPVLKSFADQSKPIQNLLILLGLLLTSTVFFGQYQLIFWTRLPIFFLGMVAAAHSAEKKYITLSDAIGAIAAMLLGIALLCLCFLKWNNFMWSYGLWWYPFILITPGLTLLISWAASLLSKTKCRAVVGLMDRLGKHTFPLYLSHIFMFSVWQTLIDTYPSIRYAVFLLMSLLSSVLFAVFLHSLTDLATRLWKLLFKAKRELSSNSDTTGGTQC